MSFTVEKTDRHPGQAPSTETQPSKQTSTLGTTFFLIFSAGIAPACLVGLTPNDMGPWPAFVALNVISAIRLGSLYYWGRPALYEMVFWIFCYLFLGLAPLAQLRLQSFPETSPGVINALLPTSAGLILAGVAAFMVGAGFSRGKVVEMRPRTLSERRTWQLAIPGLLLAMMFSAKIGFGSYVGSRDGLTLARNAAWPTDATGVVIQAACTVPLIACTAAFIQIRRTNKTTSVLIMLLAQVALLVFTTNPISSARIAFGTVFLALLAMLGAFATPSRFRISLIAILAGMVLVFPYADSFRHGTTAASFGKGNPVESMTRGDFDSFAQINNAVYYVERHGITYGRQATGAVLFWVPRSVWPDKPEDTGVVLAKDRGYGFKNLSAPLWAELFVNGSWPALLGGMGLLGWHLRRLDRRRILYGNSTVAGVILPFFLLMLLRGSLLQAMATLAAVIAVSAWLSPRVSISDPGSGGPDAPHSTSTGGSASRRGLSRSRVAQRGRQR